MVVGADDLVALRRATPGWLPVCDSVVSATWLVTSWLDGAGASVLGTGAGVSVTGTSVTGASVAGGSVTWGTETVGGFSSGGAVVVTPVSVAPEPFPASVVSVPPSAVPWPSVVTVDWLNASAYTVGDTDNKGEKAKKKARKAVNTFFIQILLLFFSY